MGEGLASCSRFPPLDSFRSGLDTRHQACIILHMEGTPTTQEGTTMETTTNTLEDVLARMATRDNDGDWRIRAAADEVKALDRWIKRVTTWHQICDEAAETGDYTRWNAYRPPSKKSKHQAYDRANHLMRLLNLVVDRPSTVPGLQAVSDAAHAVLAKVAS